MEKMLLYIVDKKKVNLSMTLIFLALLGCLGIPRGGISPALEIFLLILVVVACIYTALVFYALYYEHALFVLFVTMLTTGGGFILRLIAGSPVMLFDAAVFVAFVPIFITVLYRSLSMVVHHFGS